MSLHNGSDFTKIPIYTHFTVHDLPGLVQMGFWEQLIQKKVLLVLVVATQKQQEYLL